MKRILACLAALALPATAMRAELPAAGYDPIGDAIAAAEQSLVENGSDWALTVSLYHGGRHMGVHDSLGCPVPPMRTVAVDPAILRRGSGQVNWTGTEVLPPDLLAFLKREYGCDGVLFAELTAYRAYAPLAVGWRLKLVDVRSGQIVWAADEVFDAKRPAVSLAAQRFASPGFNLPFLRQENWVAVNSPRQFGGYTAATLLDTLPDR